MRHESLTLLLLPLDGRGFKCGVIFCSTVTAQLLMHDHKIKRQVRRHVHEATPRLLTGNGMTRGAVECTANLVSMALRVSILGTKHIFLFTAVTSTAFQRPALPQLP